MNVTTTNQMQHIKMQRLGICAASALNKHC